MVSPFQHGQLLLLLEAHHGRVREKWHKGPCDVSSHWQISTPSPSPSLPDPGGYLLQQLQGSILLPSQTLGLLHGLGPDLSSLTVQDGQALLRRWGGQTQSGLSPSVLGLQGRDSTSSSWLQLRRPWSAPSLATPSLPEPVTPGPPGKLARTQTLKSHCLLFTANGFQSLKTLNKLSTCPVPHYCIQVPCFPAGLLTTLLLLLSQLSSPFHIATT